jgi:hypothetical protein
MDKGINWLFRRNYGQIGMACAIVYGREETWLSDHYRAETLRTKKRARGYFRVFRNLIARKGTAARTEGYFCFSEEN